MKQRSARWYILPLLIVVALSLFIFTSCIGQQARVSSFYDARTSDLTITRTQFSQYLLYRFDTEDSQLTLTTPSAADIVSRFSSPIIGDIVAFTITADGSHSVMVKGGINVTVKPSASTIAGNTTRLIFCELSNVTKGTEAVTIY